MKVKDLPEDSGLVGIKVKIPKNLQDSYSGVKSEMYIFSWWGHLQYKGNPEALQDLSGEKIAEAVNNYYGKKSLDESHTCLLGCQCSKHFTNPNKEEVLIEALETIIRSTECCKEDLIIQDIRKQAEQAIAKYKEN